MSDPGAPPGKLMVDPYLDWVAKEGVPVYEDFALNLAELETKYWPRFEVEGAIAHVKGRGDFTSIFIIDLAPGAATTQLQHLFEGAALVISGRGCTKCEDHTGRTHSFEWGPNSLFAPPLNSRYQIFNTSGRERARLVIANNLPAVLNLFHNERFVFQNTFTFSEREGSSKHFAGEGDFIDVRPGKHMWETNFVPDLMSIKLHEWDARGAGSANIKLILADGVLHVHVSDMPVGSYKKAHRHTADVNVFCLSGEGYSLFWYDGDKDFIRKDWHHGWVFAPPDMMFHQHFNSGGDIVRYLAVGHGSIRYPFTQNIWNVIKGIDANVKDGGNQIEYEDQDPRVHAIFTAELAKRGLSPAGKYLEKIKA